MNRIGIIGIVDRQWSDRWQAEANVLTRVSATYPTIWVAPPHHWRATPDRWRSSTPTFWRPVEGDFEVYTPPPFLPYVHRPASLSAMFSRIRLRAARRRLLAMGCEKIVLYIWRPKYGECIDLVAHDASIYHIVDEYSFSENDPPTSAAEARLLKSVDQVIVHSPALLDKKGGVNPHTTMIPNGVDFEWFATPTAEPGDLEGIPRPRVGYCGYVKRQLDWDLIEALIQRHPDHSWIFVGKTSPHEELRPVIDRLSALPNVFFIGEKSTRELTSYPQHFDVCIMPYNVDGYTQYIFPLKLHEYLAAGRPTIGSPIRTLLDFADVIQVADGVEEWSQAISTALGSDSNLPSAISRRQEAARRYDWRSIAAEVAAVVEATVVRATA